MSAHWGLTAAQRARLSRFLFVVFITVPGLAMADTLPSLDLRSGAPQVLLGRVMGKAYVLLVFAFLIGLILEGVGKPGHHEKNIGRVVWRMLLMLFLLKAYPTICGTVVNTTQALAASIAPQNTYDSWKKTMEGSLKAYKGDATPPDGASGGSELASAAARLKGITSRSAFVAGYMGGVAFDALRGLFILVCQAASWVFRQLTNVALAFFFVVGPLALACNVPLGVDSAGRWFRTFVTIAFWPVGSALVFALSNSITSVGQSQGSGTTGASWTAIAAALLVLVLNLSVPKLCSAIIGGAIQDLVGPAVKSLALGAATLGAGALVTKSAASFASGMVVGRGGGGMMPTLKAAMNAPRSERGGDSQQASMSVAANRPAQSYSGSTATAAPQPSAGATSSPATLKPVSKSRVALASSPRAKGPIGG